jgi:hypothetical protein
MSNKESETLLQLTEHSIKFMQISPVMYRAYVPLREPIRVLAQLCFVEILDGKRNPSKNTPKENRTNEEKRIFTKKALTVEHLLGELYPFKYIDGKDCKNDVGNLRKRIKEMHDNNVMYCWKYWGVYVFVMERNISSWKYYNEKGVVTPRVIIKILDLSQEMMNSMSYRYKVENGCIINQYKMENSFCEFLNDMVSKMHPSVAEKLPLWQGNTNVYLYIEHLKSKLKELDLDSGIEEAGDFLFRLPPSVRTQLLDERGIEEEEIMNAKSSLDMEKDFVPVDGGKMGSKKKRAKGTTKRKKGVSVDPSKSIKPKMQAYEEESKDPFESAPNFILFFQKSIRLFKDSCILPSVKSETSDGGVALDIVIEGGRKGDRDFLFAWAKWYCDYRLKGNKANNVEHTSIKKFGKTFSEFNSTYQSKEDKKNLIPE